MTKRCSVMYVPTGKADERVFCVECRHHSFPAHYMLALRAGSDGLIGVCAGCWSPHRKRPYGERNLPKGRRVGGVRRIKRRDGRSARGDSRTARSRRDRHAAKRGLAAYTT